MEHGLKLMNKMLLNIMCEKREAGRQSWKERERSKRGWSVILSLPVNQTSIFSWREGRPTSNVNKGWEREGGRESTSTRMFEFITQHSSRHDLQEETRNKRIFEQFQMKTQSWAVEGFSVCCFWIFKSHWSERVLEGSRARQDFV